MRKLEMKFNKPIYVSMCIFDISKTCSYEFHEYMLPLYHEKYKVMYMIRTVLFTILSRDVIMKRDINRFDTSDLLRPDLRM